MDHTDKVPLDFEETGEPTHQSPGSFCLWPFSRRDFVKGAGAIVGSSALPAALRSEEPSTAPAKTTLSLAINGEQRHAEIDTRISLLDLLREDFHLTGTKKGCDHGQCGACTVLVDGRRVNSCLTLAITCDGQQVTTIEGLTTDGQLNPVQQAFLDNDGYQCGYCTPGQIISAVALLDEAKQHTASFVTPDLRSYESLELTDAEIRERMSGNICRCGAYPGIVAAVRQAHLSAASVAGIDDIGDSHATV